VEFKIEFFKGHMTFEMENMPQPRTYKCRYCGMEMANKDALYGHIRNSAQCNSGHSGRRRGRSHQRGTRVQVEVVQMSPHPDGEDVECEDDGVACLVCLVNKPQIVSTCGHNCLCIGCSRRVLEHDNQCPMCRQQRSVLIRVYG